MANRRASQSGGRGAVLHALTSTPARRMRRARGRRYLRDETGEGSCAQVDRDRHCLSIDVLGFAAKEARVQSLDRAAVSVCDEVDECTLAWHAEVQSRRSLRACPSADLFRQDSTQSGHSIAEIDCREAVIGGGHPTPLRRRWARQEGGQGALCELIQGDAPLTWPRITEAQQESLDATCRKLRRFICASSAANPTA